MAVNRVVVVAAAAIFAGDVLAAVSAEEAKQLGGPVLTAFGAEKAGNKEGTIPAYTGEGIKPPANFNPKSYDRPDPFAQEKPLFSITAQNYAQYTDKLHGFAEMFKRYPDFRMEVYPTHRTSTLPKWVLDNIARNATSCKGEQNELILTDCYGGIAFPIPKTGTQVMWNHLTYYVAQAWIGDSVSYLANSNGEVTNVGAQKGWEQSAFYDPGKKVPSSPDTVYWEVRLDDTAPARKVGQKLVLVDYLDNINFGRRAYQYIPGQRRVKLAPDLNYDTPAPTGGGAMTMDDGKTFLGPLDRYDWKLIGKTEKFIPYNNFKLLTTHDGTCSPKVAMTKNFLNPNCLRWELHRVWHVQGTVKPGRRHIYAKRDMYWDEDSYGAGIGESYDASGKLYRIALSVGWPFYEGEGGGIYQDLGAIYDLQTGNWVFNGLTAEPGTGWTIDKRQSEVFYSPEALAGEGIR